jgi:hypothetical protein
MNEKPETGPDPLRALLRTARPRADMPPRFEQAVWRRIEREEAATLTARSRWGWLEAWVERLWHPRLVVAGMALLLVAGGVTGAVTSTGVAKEAAQQRYLSAVAPNVLR